MRHWILLCPASLHFLESSTCQGATAVAIDWLLLQGQHSMMFFAKNEKYSHVLQVFLANTGWNFFTEDSVTIPANTGFNLKRKFV